MTVKRRSWWRKELTWVSARAVILHGHSALTTQCCSVHEILQATILERLPCPPPGDLPHSGIEPGSLKSPALAAGFFTTGATWEAFWLHKGKGKGKETEVAQSCPTLCDPVDGNLPGSSVHGIFQARVLEWWPFPSPGDLPDPGIEPGSPALQADALLSEPPGKQ